MITPRKMIVLSLVIFSAAVAFAVDPVPAKKRKRTPTSTPVNPFATGPYFPKDPYAGTKSNISGNPYYPTRRTATRNPYLTTPSSSSALKPSGVGAAGSSLPGPSVEP